MSPFHFQRTFAILTDMSVGEYLRKRRLTKAAHELCSSTTKIQELAHKYGYDTPESFTKAFQKQHGITPSEARNRKGHLQSYNRLRIHVDLTGAEPIEYQLVLRDRFQVVGVKEKIYFDCNETDGPIPEIMNFWHRVKKKGTSRELMALNDGDTPGLIGLTVDASQQNKELEYWIGTIRNNVPEGLNCIEIPAEKWAVFTVDGPMLEALPRAWEKIYGDWFPSNDFEPSGAPTLEIFQSSDLTSQNAQGEIWIPVKG